MPSYDSVNKRILSKLYDDPNQLAREIAAGLASLSRQPSFSRGLARDTIADIQGGTTLGVGDPSAAHISDVLIQNPQPGIPRDIGSGLRTRRQSRIETRVRQVPAIVTETAGAGDDTINARIVAYGTTKSSDSVTGIETVGDPLSNLAASGMDFADVVGEDFVVDVSGSPFVSSGSTGIQPPLAGQTIFVTLAEQWEVSTTWTKRYRKHLPTVVRVLKSRTATLANGLSNVVS